MVMHCNGTDPTGCLVVEIVGIPDTVQNVLVKLTPLISDEIRFKLEIVFQITLFTVTSLFGVVANVINITVYWRQGLKDSITVGLFALSVSDFFVVFFPLFTAACYVADHLFPELPIQFVAVAGVSVTQARHMIYPLSCSLMAFLSIERCFCIIRPFKVKLIFTRRRTTIVILGITLFYVMAFLPVFSTHQLRWQSIPRRNFTEYLTLWYHPAAIVVRAYNNSLMAIFVPTAAQVIVTCTAIIMIHGLRKASKFRQEATGSSKQTKDPNNETIQTKKNPEVLDSRDARLVKTVVILVAILSAANIPYMALKYTEIFIPEMNPRKRYANTFRLCASINFILGSLNASANALVYYYTGSRYREMVKDMFSRSKK